MKARQRPRQKKRATRRENLQMACVFLALWLAISVFLVFAAERQAEAYRAEPSVVMGTLQDARRVWSRNHMELEVWIGGVGCETDDGWLGWTYGLSDTLEGLSSGSRRRSARWRAPNTRDWGKAPSLCASTSMAWNT